MVISALLSFFMCLPLEISGIVNSNKNEFFMPTAISYLGHQVPVMEIFKEQLDLPQAIIDYFGPFNEKNHTLDNQISKFLNKKALDELGSNDNAVLTDFAQYLSASPVYRSTVYAGDDVCSGKLSDDKQRIKQVYLNGGESYEVPCYSCSKTSETYLTSIYVLPRRDFYSNLQWEDRDFDTITSNSNSSTKVHVSTAFLEIMNKLLNKEYAHEDFTSTFIQSISSGNGVRLDTDLFNRTTNLQMSPSHRLTRIVDTSKNKNKKIPDLSKLIISLQNAVTFQCILTINETETPSDVLLNVDHIEDLDTPNRAAFTRIYEEIKEFDKTIYAPILIQKANLKVEVKWEPYSCCSSCCCEPKFCGIFAKRRCNALHSVKSRRGFLSVTLLNEADKVKPVNNFDSSSAEKLDSLLRMSPYDKNGIPLFSTMLGIEFKELRTIVVKEIGKRGSKGSSLTRFPGIFVEEASCQNDPQKMNCSLLAECMGLELKGEETIEKDVEFDIDPCRDVDITILMIDEKKVTLRVEEGKNYQFRIDPNIFDVITKVKWRVSGRSIKEYDPLKKCADQEKAIHLNGQDLLMINLDKEDTERRLEATLYDGTKLLVILDNADRSNVTSSHSKTIIIWSSVILAFAILVIVAVVVIDRIRKRRTKKAIAQNAEELKKDEDEQLETAIEPTPSPSQK